jgi:hypothetical protein
MPGIPFFPHCWPLQVARPARAVPKLPTVSREVRFASLSIPLEDSRRRLLDLNTQRVLA